MTRATVECEGCDAPCCRAFVVRAPVRLNRRGGWQLDGKLRAVPANQNSFAQAGIPLKVTRITHGLALFDCEALVDSRCAVYEDRPPVCRTYDCRDDENRIRSDDTARCAWPRDPGERTIVSG
jgi:Fe-S-cluster containining protein